MRGADNDRHEAPVALDWLILATEVTLGYKEPRSRSWSSPHHLSASLYPRLLTAHTVHPGLIPLGVPWAPPLKLLLPPPLPLSPLCVLL